MIKGVHTMFYSSDPEGLREFLSEKLGLSGVDIGEGWMIFDLPEADMGVHPTEHEHEAVTPSGTAHLSFYCENIEETVAELRSKDVEFKGEIEDLGWGFVTQMKVPGDFYVQLYQPKYGR